MGGLCRTAGPIEMPFGGRLVLVQGTVYYMGGKDWRHLANAIGRSVLGGDAGFRQITLLRVARDNHRFSSVTE